MKLGKRLYIASQGRFLQADPIEGGTPNEYTYVVDPVNSNDFSGEAGVFQWGVCIYECYSRDALAIERTGGSIGGVNKALAPYTDSNGTANLSRKSVHISGTPYRIPAIVVKPRGQQPTRNDWTLAKAYAVTLSIALSSANASAAAAANNLAKQIAEGIRKNALGISGTNTNVPSYNATAITMLLEVTSRNSEILSSYPWLIFHPEITTVLQIAKDCKQFQSENCMADLSVMSATVSAAAAVALAAGLIPAGGIVAGSGIGANAGEAGIITGWTIHGSLRLAQRGIQIGSNFVLLKSTDYIVKYGNMTPEIDVQGRQSYKYVVDGIGYVVLNPDGKVVTVVAKAGAEILVKWWFGLPL